MTYIKFTLSAMAGLAVLSGTTMAQQTGEDIDIIIVGAVKTPDHVVKIDPLKELNMKEVPVLSAEEEDVDAALLAFAMEGSTKETTDKSPQQKLSTSKTEKSEDTISDPLTKE